MEISERRSRGRRLLQDTGGVVKNGKVSASSLTWENKNDKTKGSQSKEFKIDTLKMSKEATPASAKLTYAAKDHEKESYPTICDLCPEDKKRVKELIEQVARLGSEKENLIGEMAKERDAYKGLLETLKTQCHDMSEKKNSLETELKLLQAPAVASAAPMVPDYSGPSNIQNPYPSVHLQSQQLFHPPSQSNQLAPHKHYKTGALSYLPAQSEVGSSSTSVPASHSHQQQLAHVVRPNLSPTCSSSTFTDVQLSPSRHLKSRTISRGISHSDVKTSSLQSKPSQPPHRNKCRHSSSLYHQPALGSQPAPPTKQRIRFPSGMSSISSISATDEDADNSMSCFTGNLPFLHPHGTGAKRSLVAMKEPKIKHPVTVSERTTVNETEMSSVSSVMEATSNGIPAAVTRTHSSITGAVPYPRRNSHSTMPVAVDSSTQTLNVESKAIQTEKETSLHAHGRETAAVACSACHGLATGTSSFMPSAYVPSCEVAVVQDRGTTPDIRCGCGNLSSQSHDIHRGSAHHSIDHKYDSIKVRSLGHTSHTMEDVPTNAPWGLSRDVQNKTTRSYAQRHPLQPDDATLTSLNGVSAPTTTQNNRSIPHTATCSSSTACRTTPRTIPAPTAYLPGGTPQATEVEQDMLLVSGLLNADSCGDADYHPHEGSHLLGEEDAKATQCHKLQLTASPKTSLLDIAFALNCHQPPPTSSEQPHPSSPTVHISIASPASYTTTSNGHLPALPGHKEHCNTREQHWSPVKNSSPTTTSHKISGRLASPLNQYKEEEDLPAISMQAKLTDYYSSGIEDHQTESLPQTGTGTHGGMEDKANSLLNNLFFIQ